MHAAHEDALELAGRPVYAPAQQPLLERPFDSQSPLHRINLINEIRNLAFPTAGEYSIIVEIDEEPILATSITVTGI